MVGFDFAVSPPEVNSGSLYAEVLVAPAGASRLPVTTGRSGRRGD